MAFKKIRNDYYLIDTKEDLNSLRENDMGAQVYVIKEAAEYQLMSTGEWVKQTPAVSGSTGGAEIDTSMFATKDELENAVNSIVVPSVEGLASIEFVEEAIASIEHPTTDLSGLATETYVDEKIAAIEHPSVDLTGLASEAYVDEAIAAINAVPVMKMFAEDAEIMASNPGSQFGIALNKGDTRTLPEAMLEKGVGMYSFWIHKSNQSLPAEALAKNSSCRGVCCVDTVKPTGWYGWVLLFDQDGDAYTQYIRNSQPTGWISCKKERAFEIINCDQYNLTFSNGSQGDAAIFDAIDKIHAQGKTCHLKGEYRSEGYFEVAVSGYEYDRGDVLTGVTLSGYSVNTETGKMEQIGGVIVKINNIATCYMTRTELISVI